MKKSGLISILIPIFLCSCKLGPSYHPPQMDIPENWKNCQKVVEESTQVDFWWQIFNDERLHSLELCAVENNRDIYVALERVVEARALAGVSRADLFPQLTLNPSYTNTAILYKLFLPPLNIPLGNGSRTVFRVHEVQYNFPLNLSYEVDLWGKYKGIYHSAYLSAQAEEEALRSALLTLTSNLATSYFQLRALDAQINILQETRDIRQRGLEIIQSRFDKGLAIYSDISNAELLLANVEAQYFDTVRLRNIQENMIAVYIGIPPAELCLESNPLQDAPPEIPASLPSQILLQRPDIAEAEREVASRHALIGVAYASFLPSLNLTGVLGYSSPDLRDFMTWNSRLWGIGANSTMPIFDACRNIDNLQATWARFRQASGTYQQKVLVAFQEVEDALNNIEWQAKESQSLQKAVEASSMTAKLSQSRYNNGITSYLEVVESTRSDLDAKLSYTSLLGIRYVSTIQLIRALGGSWTTTAGQEYEY